MRVGPQQVLEPRLTSILDPVRRIAGQVLRTSLLLEQAARKKMGQDGKQGEQNRRDKGD